MKPAIVGLVLLLILANAAAGDIEIEPLPALVQPVSNNAVTLLKTENGHHLYSFLGLGAGLTWKDITADGFVLKPGANNWTQLADVPGSDGRLAASAIGLAGYAWLIGGYTVDAGGAEKSTPAVYRIRPGESRLQWVTDMPVPVEDSVVLGYLDRYIYLVSGWHDLGNVNLVQVFDTGTGSWAQATPWPGAPVFGHAGGISGDRLLVCDGVRIEYSETDEPRKFLPSDECWSGKVDARDHRRIEWQKRPPHPGPPRYRMAATGDDRQRVVFAGGSVNPYNFNGTGYNGVAAEPEDAVFSYSFKAGEWRIHGRLPQATMDHRGLPYADGWYHLIGGMHSGQETTGHVLRFRLDDL